MSTTSANLSAKLFSKKPRFSRAFNVQSIPASSAPFFLTTWWMEISYLCVRTGLSEGRSASAMGWDGMVDIFKSSLSHSHKQGRNCQYSHYSGRPNQVEKQFKSNHYAMLPYNTRRSSIGQLLYTIQVITIHGINSRRTRRRSKDRFGLRLRGIKIQERCNNAKIEDLQLAGRILSLTPLAFAFLRESDTDRTTKLCLRVF